MRLQPCPDKPNCVSSLADPEDAQHYIAPLRVGSTAAEALERVRKVLAARTDVTIEAEEPEYLHAVFTTRLFRFKDDVEFQWDPNALVLHVRSASRVGHSDLGVNRKRVEALRSALLQGPRVPGSDERL